MGCGGSKRGDISRDRERERINTNTNNNNNNQNNNNNSNNNNNNPNPNNPNATSRSYNIQNSNNPNNINNSNNPNNNPNLGRSVSKEINIIPANKSSLDENNNNIYGTSYTNRKTREYDLLHDIVANTRNNFIDVNHSIITGELLDENEKIERSKKYNQTINNNEIYLIDNGGPNIDNNNNNNISKSGHIAINSTLNSTHSPWLSHSLLFQPIAIETSQKTLNNSKLSLDLNELIGSIRNGLLSSQDYNYITEKSSSVSEAIQGTQITQNTKFVLTFEEL